MSNISLATTIHVWEDTDTNFEIRDILAQAGLTSTKGLSINALSVTLPDGTTSTKNTPLFGKVDVDTLYVKPGQWHVDYNGQFATMELVVEQGTGGAVVTLKLTVIVDPVNDAPSAANKTFSLADGKAVVLAATDFGFVDAVEHNNFKSVIITTLPSNGQLLLNGAAVAANTEVTVDDIAAGKLSYQPSQTVAGSFDVGFKVRDDGGTVGAGAADTSVATNYLTFKVPPAHLGDFVWEDSNGNGVQDAGEAGLANVTVQLKAADGHVVATTTTDASGAYHFDVDPGTYSVTVQAPAGYVATTQGAGGNSAADSDIDASGGTAAITLAPGETNNKADAGLVRPVAVDGNVWVDANRNGVQDSGEAAATGVKVTLLDASGNAAGSATTDASGHYQFSNLKPGSYSVQFDQATLPQGYVWTAAGQGADTGKDSDADAATGKTAGVTLNSGAAGAHLDAGAVVVQATVGDRVWEDSNGDGVQDSGELGLDGVTVSLKDASGKVVSTTTTHDGGQYSFKVDPGTYTVSVTPPAGYSVAAQGQGVDAAADSDIDASGNASVKLAAGQAVSDLDAGLYRAVSIADTVWYDANRNGLQDSGETGVAGVKVTLLDADGKAVGATVTTDASGNYQFSNLKPGTYSVVFDKATLPADTAFTTAGQDSDANASTGATTQVTLNSGDATAHLDAGIVKVQATIGDHVWVDNNGNNVQDQGEDGLDGVQVDLKDASGKVVATTVTHDGGQYNFTVDPGVYSIAVGIPAGYHATGQNTGGPNVGLIDSDIDASGNSAQFTLKAGQVKSDIDAGLYQGVSLGDTVWTDTNRNGIKDDGESGRAGVKVLLLDANGATVATAVTGTDGKYLFTDLKPGAYSVQFDKSTLGDNYVFTNANAGTDVTINSHANTSTGATEQVKVVQGGASIHLGAGVVALPATIGDRVWEDKNGNGVQDSGEAGLTGVTVQLKDASGNVVQTTTTGADGKYSFTVDPGKYSVSVTAPTGYSVTGQNAGGTGATDSDVDASGQSALVTVGAGETNNTIDAGLYQGATLGDKVWLDLNRNGVQDSGEAGVQGVSVILLDANGNAVGAPAVTDANGNYSFTNLKPGAYSVQFDKGTLPANYIFTSQDTGSNDAIDSDANATTGKTASVTLASGGVYKDLDAGVMAIQAKIGDTVWEDRNGNGVQDSGEAGIAGVNVKLLDTAGKTVATTTTDASGHYNFSANPGTYTVQVTAPTGYSYTGQDAGSDDGIDSDVGASGKSGAITVAAGDVNNTVDAGLYKTATVGDKVWLDANKNGVQDSGETGVSGVKIILLDADGKQVATATTDTSGAYSFANLKPGAYSIQVDKASLPAGYGFTTQGAGSNAALDSDVSADGVSKSFSLISGQAEKNIDVGLLQNATIGDKVWIDANGNGIQDSGEAGKSGVKVELKNAAGDVIATTTTDSNGAYKFAVAAGTYSVDVTAPTGYSFTQKGQGSSAADSNADADGHLGTVTVAAGETNSTMDAGIYQKAAIGDKVWLDSNGDGIQQSTEAGKAGVTVKLLNAAGAVIASDVTDAYGKYSFTDLAPGKYSVQFVASDGYLYTKANASGSTSANDSDASISTGKTGQITLVSGQTDNTIDAGLVKAASIGSTVWEDSDYDGVQDSGEAGLAGVTVKLYDTNNVLKASTVTDAEGHYQFDNLYAGSYVVEVTKGSGYYFTKSNIGNDSYDSDVTASSSSATTARTGTISLAAGDNQTNWDAGLYRKASIGDKVWRDSNHNGIQDSGEEGIGGISVSLYDAATGKQVGATIKTDANGNYKFSNLDPGSYYLQFDKTNAMFAGVNMNTWKWGVKNVGSNDKIDSDVNGDGKSLTNVTTTDKTFLSSGENDMSWDATITPIAIDLNGDGIQTIARSAMTGSFDLLGSGKAIQTGWLSSGDGFLAIDNNGNGQIDDISELFGGVAKGSGFAKLATYDSNHDGVLDAKDADFGKLLVWQDANSNGKTDAGELMSLAQAGVASLKVSYVELPFLDANNNLHLERSSVTLSNGETTDMTDVYFNVAASDAAAAGVTTATIDQLMADAATTGAQQITVVGQSDVPHL